jgi:hypothetical protein
MTGCMISWPRGTCCGALCIVTGSDSARNHEAEESAFWRSDFVSEAGAFRFSLGLRIRRSLDAHHPRSAAAADAALDHIVEGVLPSRNAHGCKPDRRVHCLVAAIFTTDAAHHASPMKLFKRLLSPSIARRPWIASPKHVRILFHNSRTVNAKARSRGTRVFSADRSMAGGFVCRDQIRIRKLQPLFGGFGGS